MKDFCRNNYGYFAGLALVFLAGCGSATDAIVAESQQKFLVAELSGEPQSIANASASFTDGMQVILAGRIYAPSASPFDPLLASFTVFELPEPGHNHDDPNDCPFCKRKVQNADSAIVQLCGADGQPINVPADKLLGLEKNQDVVIRGSCSKVGELLIVNADSVHVLEKAKASELAARFVSESKTE